MRLVFLKLSLFLLAVYLPWLAVVKFQRDRYAIDDYADWKLKFAIAGAESGKSGSPHIAVGDCLVSVGMLPTKIDPKLYNFGIPGATPVEGYFLVKRYLESGKKPERVYLMFGMTHFQLSDTFQEYFLSFGVLNAEEILTLMKDIRVYGSPEIGKPHWTKSWGKSALTLFGVNAEIPVEVRSRLFTSYHDIVRDRFATMVRTKGQHFYPEEHEQIYLPSPLVNYAHFDLHPLIDVYLRKMLDLLREAKIETVVDFVPNNAVTFQKYSPALRDEMQRFREELKRDYPEIAVGDISEYPPELFSDADHLNEAGAMKFSEEFRVRYYQNSHELEAKAASRN